VTAKKNLWEVHHDPYDVSQVWIRNHHQGGWMTATWKHLDSAPAPFGELAWDHARQHLAAQGRRATEAEIAQAVAALLQRAGGGPAQEPGQTAGQPAGPSRREQRVAARTKATAAPAWPHPDPPAQAAQDTESAADTDAGSLAEVVPLRVFDAREEASRWW
jgi:putative transposase